MTIIVQRPKVRPLLINSHSFVQLSNQMTSLFNQKTKMALAASKLIEKTNDSNKEYHESKIVAERGTCTNK